MNPTTLVGRWAARSAAALAIPLLLFACSDGTTDSADTFDGADTGLSDVSGDTADGDTDAVEVGPTTDADVDADDPRDGDTEVDHELDSGPDGDLEVLDADSGDADADADADTTDADGDTTVDDPGDDRPPLTDRPLRIRFDRRAADFFGTPWPSDARLLPDGTVDLRSFPNANAGMMLTFRQAIEGTIAGFSTMPVGYFAFESAPETLTLPQPIDTLEASAAVQLIELGDDGCGRRSPLDVMFEPRSDVVRPANVLSATPVPGFLLSPGTTYGFVVLRTLGLDDDHHIERPHAFARALQGEGDTELVASLRPLIDCLERDELDLGDVAVATVFTTQDPVVELQRLRDFVVDPEQVASPVVSELEVHAESSAGRPFVNWRGLYETPIFQAGVSPYSTGGRFVFDADGVPVIQRMEAVPFSIAVPSAGEGPFPVLLYMDGTGFDLRGSAADRVVRSAIDAGFAVAMFAPQFHDTRATPVSDPVAHGFNFLNPDSGRAVFRQQAVDTAYFVRVLREALADREIAPQIDASTLVYGGHSQGGLIGAMVAGVETEFVAYVLNGTGSYMSVTIVERTTPLDIPALIREFFGLRRSIDIHHPIAAVVQLGTDVVDPHNYAPRWRGRPGHERGAHVLVINGYNDNTTFPRSMNAIAIAGELAPIDPPGWDIDPHAVWHGAPQTPPFSGNVDALDGSPLTMATFLDRDRNHFTIHNNPEARSHAVNFWTDALVGVPTVRRD